MEYNTSVHQDNLYEYPGTSQKYTRLEHLRIVAQDLEGRHLGEIGLYLANYITALSLQVENLLQNMPKGATNRRGRGSVARRYGSGGCRF